MLVTSEGVAHSYDGGISNMKTVEQVKKAFHESRIVGEKLLSQGKITWEDFAFTMIGFELSLKAMGEDL